MKRTMLVLSLVAAGTSFLGSCNKDLKNDVKSLQTQSDSLLKAGLDLQKRLQKLNDAVGSGEPMSVNTTFQDNNNASRTVQGTYRYRSNTTITQSITKMESGAYQIRVIRAADLAYYEMGDVQFLYEPNSKQITNITGQHTWADRDPYADLFFFEGPPETAGLTSKIDLQKIDPATGDISFVCTSTATPEYTAYGGDWRIPNPNKNVTTTISFSGRLQKTNYH